MAYTDFLIKPYSSDDMVYKKTIHQYVGVLEKISFLTGLSLSTIWDGNDNALWYLEQVSQVIYTLILKQKDSKYFYKLQYYLAHSKKARKAILDSIVDVVQYNHEDGGFLIAYQTGINLHEMKEIRMKIESAISVIGDQIIDNFGFKERYFRSRMNTLTYYDDLSELLSALVTLSIITSEQASTITAIDQISYNERYQVFSNTENKFVLEDTKTLKYAMEKYGVDW